MISTFHPTPGIPSDGAGDPGVSPYDVPWELYDLRSDFSQSADVAAQEPERERDLSMLWFAMAGKYGLFPLHGEQLMGSLRAPTATSSSSRCGHLPRRCRTTRPSA